MGTKTLIRLVIALAVVGVIAVIMHFAGGGGVSKVTSTTARTKVFDNFPLNDVFTITIKDKARSLTLKKGKKSWEIVERENYPANSPVVNALLKSLWDLKINQKVAVVKSQLNRLSLLDPADKAAKDGETASILTFLDKDGKELASMWMGKIYQRSDNRPNPYGGGMSMSDAGRYVRRGDSNFVYLVGDSFKNVVTDPAEWLSEEFFKVEKIKTIAIKSGEAKDDWKLVRKDENGEFEFAKKNKGELEIDPGKTYSMKTAFGNNARFEDVFVGEEAKKAKVGKTSFEITTFDGFTYQISAGEKDDLNNLPLTVKVSAKFQEKRKPGEEESDEEKKMLDEAFAANLKTLRKKLAKEKAMEGHVYKVRSSLVDTIAKKRSELLKEKEKTATGTPGGSGGVPMAPGVNLPLPAGHPVSKPKKTPKLTPPAPKKTPIQKPKKAELPKIKKPAVKPAPKPKAEPKPAAKPKPAARPKPAAKPAAAEVKAKSAVAAEEKTPAKK